MKYLNADGMTDLAMIGYMTGVVSRIRERISSQEWQTETKRTVSTAATFLGKAYNQVCGELDPKQGKALVNRLQSWKGAKFDLIRPSLAKQDKEKEMIEIEKDDLYDMLEHIIGGGCTNCVDPKSCRFQELLLKYDVPISNNYRECPYWNDKIEPIGNVGERMILAMHATENNGEVK